MLSRFRCSDREGVNGGGDLSFGTLCIIGFLIRWG